MARAFKSAANLIDRLQWNDNCKLPPKRSFAEPIYDPDELAGVIPTDYRTPLRYARGGCPSGGWLRFP